MWPGPFVLTHTVSCLVNWICDGSLLRKDFLDNKFIAFWLVAPSGEVCIYCKKCIFPLLTSGFFFFRVGEYDHLPEQAFYMVGPIEEAVAKADKLAEEHSWGGLFGKLSTGCPPCCASPTPNPKISVCSVGHMRALFEDVFCLKSI